MSKSSTFPAFDQFVTVTTGRNMTTPARVAVVAGMAAMVLLTVDPAYQALHYLIDAVLWTCLVFFVFEWVIRLRHSASTYRRASYILSFRGIVGAASSLAVPIALAAGVNTRTAWLLGMFWVLKAVPGIRGLRQLRRVIVQESRPLFRVLGIFLLVLFMVFRGG